VALVTEVLSLRRRVHRLRVAPPPADAGVPYAPRMLVLAGADATNAAADADADGELPEFREGDLVRAAPGLAAYAELAHGALGAGDVGVVRSVGLLAGVSAGALGSRVVTVARLDQDASTREYAYDLLALAPAVRLELAPPPPPPLARGHFVRLAPGADVVSDEDEDADEADVDAHARLRRGELGLVTRAPDGGRAGVHARRVGCRAACAYAASELVRAEPPVRLVAGERCVLHRRHRGPLPSAADTPRLRQRHVGTVVALVGAGAAARLRVAAHDGSVRAYRPEALERAAPPRKRPDAEADAECTPCTLRADTHGHAVGLRAAPWPLMARYSGSCCTECDEDAPQATSARCTLGCRYDICVSCLEADAQRSAEQEAAAALPRPRQPPEPLEALHLHPLAGLNEAAAWPAMLTWRDMRWGWRCDECRRPQAGPDGRYRCTAGCDFDVCDDCAAAVLLGSTAPPLAVGAAVVLSDGFACFGDAADGPLRLGQRGVVTAVQPEERLSFCVVPADVGREDSDEEDGWWYMRAALLPAPADEDEPAAPAAVPATSPRAGRLGAALSSGSTGGGGGGSRVRNTWSFFNSGTGTGDAGSCAGRAAEPDAPAAAVAALRYGIVACALHNAAPPEEDESAEVVAVADAVNGASSEQESEEEDEDEDDEQDEEEEADHRLMVYRDAVVASSAASLGPLGSDAWKQPLYVSFGATQGGRREEGSDGGGAESDTCMCTSVCRPLVDDSRAPPALQG
jgi:hypothetical protein